MRKPKPIELEISISDNEFIQNKINSLFIDIIKYTLENSNSTQKEKILYINSIIKKLKSE